MSSIIPKLTLLRGILGHSKQVRLLHWWLKRGCGKISWLPAFGRPHDNDDDDDLGVSPGAHPPSKMPKDYGYEISHFFVALGLDKTSLIATKILYLKTIAFAVARYKMVNIDQTVKRISIWYGPIFREAMPFFIRMSLSEKTYPFTPF